MLGRSNGSVTRRALVGGGLASAVAAALAACAGRDQSPTATAPSPSSSPLGLITTPSSSLAVPACVLRPEETEGPYFVDEKLNRSDIRTDPTDGSNRLGVPLRLAMTVSAVSGSACAALSGAQVDVWHCDAAGVYSDQAANNSSGKKFLRGYQVTDVAGKVEFQTIYPGWYSGRSIHLHFKILSGAGAQRAYRLTSQIFFDETVSDRVMSQPPYNGRGARDTRNQADIVYRGGNNSGARLMADLSPEGAGYLARFDVGLNVG